MHGVTTKIKHLTVSNPSELYTTEDVLKYNEGLGQFVTLRATKKKSVLLQPKNIVKKISACK